ncbi:Uncharacterised protein [Yersinia intermedia]|uniref:hypothetical protein n=1 Tax=Yersinia intermedia TaxID=631 RepID=UPI0005EA2206|nr:hypothetical protein [Yersinia intermedia]CND13648.1 Uncharacterised protein [Yersinia intermedia]CNH38959.1 Uncharacterised protein [Yersinia intermedia]
MRKHKILLATVSLLAIIAILGYFFSKNQKNNTYAFKCEADVKYDVDDTRGVSSIDALYVLTLGTDGKGLLHMSGVVRQMGQKLDLNRTYYFDFTKHEKIDIYKALITEEKVSVYDAVDNQFFHETFLPEKPGSYLYIKARKIKENLYIFDGFSYTHLLCASS